MNCFEVSVDGFGAGPGQNLENPLEVGGMGPHEWVFLTHIFHRMHGSGKGGTTGVGNDFAKRGVAGLSQSTCVALRAGEGIQRSAGEGRGVLHAKPAGRPDAERGTGVGAQAISLALLLL